MKTSAFVMSLAAATAAYAGFRHPIEETGKEAAQIQATPVAASKVGPVSAVFYGPALPAHVVTQQQQSQPQLQQAKPPVAQAPAASAKPVANIPVYRPSTDQVRGPVKSGAIFPKHTPWSKFEKAPPLPSSPNVKVGDVNIPSRERVSIKKDPQPIYDLKGLNKEQVIRFAQKARAMPLPMREIIPEAKAAVIAARYQDALQIVPHKTIRTPLKLDITKISKIIQPPNPIAYENMVKRIDALFFGLELRFQVAVFALWELSQSKENHKDLQPRDALFAGLLSKRAGWENAAAYLFEEAVTRKVENQERYLKLLWNELESFQSIALVENSIQAIDPEKVRIVAPSGDQANFALTRLILGNTWAKVRDAGFSEERIGSTLLRQRITLMRALAALRDPKAPKSNAIYKLRELEANAVEPVRQEARLALARTLLQQGGTQEALDFYQRINKDGKNRLEVMAEQSYAEYRAGRHQESLGKALGLQSPYFQFGFAPDIHVIEVLNRKQLCDFGGADEGLQRFAERYGRELGELDRLLARKPKPLEFYSELISYHDNETPYRFQRYMLHLSSVMENQKLLNKAESEISMLEKVGTRKYEIARPEGWTGFLVSMRKSWDKHAAEYKTESASLALTEAAYMAKRLRHSFAQAELLGLDVSTAATRDFNLQSALNFPARRASAEALAKDKFHWPFEQEVWEDELDFLKIKNPSKCAAVAKNP